VAFSVPWPAVLFGGLIMICFASSCMTGIPSGFLVDSYTSLLQIKSSQPLSGIEQVKSAKKSFIFRWMPYHKTTRTSGESLGWKPSVLNA
jgi:hypothetical protein